MDGTIDRVPDGITPLTGYRMWRVALEGSDVTFHPPSSQGTPFAWMGATSGWVSATCYRSFPGPARSTIRTHDVPVEACSCGFYAMKELDRELLFGSLIDIEVLSQAASAEYVVIGRVDLAGKVIEHDFGYRAERARIVELFPVRGSFAPVRELAKLLGLELGPEVVPFGLDVDIGPFDAA